MEPRTLRKICDHEAAHALVAWHYGYALHKVTVAPPLEERLDRGVNGCCSYERPDPGVEFVSRPTSLNAADVWVLLAGRASDDLFHPGEPRGDTLDMLDLAKLCPLDGETLAMHEFTPAARTLDEFYDRFKEPVVKILKSRSGRRAHRPLSKELERAKILSGRRAAEILSRAWGRKLPEKARPPEEHMGLLDRKTKTYEEALDSIKTFLGIIKTDLDALKGLGEPWQAMHRNRLLNCVQIFESIMLDPPVISEGDSDDEVAGETEGTTAAVDR